MSGREQAYIQNAFDTNWVAPLGPNVDGFESEICLYTGVSATAALTSGTAALHLALILSGVQRGDIVICQSMTFAASANPIVYLGGTPVFVDSEQDTWNICPEALETAIRKYKSLGKNIRAIIVVHLYGMPAKMDEIRGLSRQYEIPLIEDAAEAFGSHYEGTPCGALGYFGVLSFNGNKIITTSGGGALLSDDIQAIEKARFLSTQARDDAPHYEHSEIGYNYRLSNILAGIGRGQLQVLDERVAARRSLNIKYRSLLGKYPGIQFQSEPDARFYSNFWLTAILIDPAMCGGISASDVSRTLNSENIDARPLWKPMHLQPVFSDAPYFGGRTAEQLFRSGLCLPSGSNLSDESIDRIFKVMSDILPDS